MYSYFPQNAFFLSIAQVVTIWPMGVPEIFASVFAFSQQYYFLTHFYVLCPKHRVMESATLQWSLVPLVENSIRGRNLANAEIHTRLCPRNRLGCSIAIRPRYWHMDVAYLEKISLGRKTEITLWISLEEIITKVLASSGGKQKKECWGKPEINSEGSKGRATTELGSRREEMLLLETRTWEEGCAQRMAPTSLHSGGR